MPDLPQLPYRDRRHAGQCLAAALGAWRDRPGLVVLALPRGGVPVGFEVAQALGAPLDVLVVRKLGYPGREEYAMGAIASGGVRVMKMLPGMHVSGREVERVAAREQAELERRELLYREGRSAARVQGRPVVLVDDGLATGATMQAAIAALRRQRPQQVCVAVPVGAPEACEALRALADELVCPASPHPFRAVSLWYRDFPQTVDEEVRALLGQAQRATAASGA